MKNQVVQISIIQMTTIHVFFPRGVSNSISLFPNFDLISCKVHSENTYKFVGYLLKKLQKNCN